MVTLQFHSQHGDIMVPLTADLYHCSLQMTGLHDRSNNQQGYTVVHQSKKKNAEVPKSKGSITATLHHEHGSLGQSGPHHRHQPQKNTTVTTAVFSSSGISICLNNISLTTAASVYGSPVA